MFHKEQFPTAFKRNVEKIQKCGKWMIHKLIERQLENRKTICKIASLPDRNEKVFYIELLLCGDEKWILFENPKCKKLWVTPGGQPAKNRLQNQIDSVRREYMLCLGWDQKVYFELLKLLVKLLILIADRTTNLINLNHALIEKRPEWVSRHGKVILQHDNAPLHRSNPVTIQTLGWEIF